MNIQFPRHGEKVILRKLAQEYGRDRLRIYPGNGKPWVLTAGQVMICKMPLPPEMAAPTAPTNWEYVKPNYHEADMQFHRFKSNAELDKAVAAFLLKWQGYAWDITLYKTEVVVDSRMHGVLRVFVSTDEYWLCQELYVQAMEVAVPGSEPQWYASANDKHILMAGAWRKDAQKRVPYGYFVPLLATHWTDPLHRLKPKLTPGTL